MSPSPEPPRLRVRGLTKRFGAYTVLDHVDLDVEPGSIVLLTGNNGSGKTTLLRCVAGLARARGDIEVDGRPLTADPASRRAVGYLPQSVGLPAWATGDEVLALFAGLRGEAVAAFPLPDGFLPPMDRPLGTLSGGQRQRLAFAVALLGQPRLLLLDEPAANLDDDGRALLGALLRTVRDAGASVVVAAPSPGDLAGLPDRQVRLSQGRIERQLQEIVR
ncbi:ATP-binding cassette domain-containing protein [Egicoccus sp. AB-alg6-2]|uniref:ATP-binding cassette domain-containing protein n=1 Tax=Egicoccus sp. AB-alg6-2 TaxID=3242692 RepID=UPI00359D6987